MVTDAFPASRLLLLPDGKFLRFRGYDTLTDRHTGPITRYHQDGALDTSFNFPREYASVSAAASLGDGRLLVLALRYVYDVFLEDYHLLRLNTDGSIDTTFHRQVLTPAPGLAWLAVQPDGKILATQVNQSPDMPGQRILRFLSDGRLDPDFTPPVFTGGAAGISARPVTLPGGKILISGNFKDINGTASLGVSRLNADGSLDGSFKASGFDRGAPTGAAPGPAIRSILVEEDGKILLGGTFYFGSGFPRPTAPLFRLHSDGSADSTYSPQVSVGANNVLDAFRQPDGKVVAGVGSSVKRFNTDGTLDTTFANPTTYYPGFSGQAHSIALLPDGRMLVAGTIASVGSPPAADSPRAGVARLNSDGSVDASFTPQQRTGTERWPTTFVRRSDGSTLAAFGGPYRPLEPGFAFNLACLRPDGTLVPGSPFSSSNPNSIFSREFNAHNLAQLADGRLFLYGYGWDEDFTDSDARATVVLPDGSEDTTFRFEPSGTPRRAVPLPDGKLLLSPDLDATAVPEGILSQFLRSGRSDPSFELDPAIRAMIIRSVTGNLLSFYATSRVLAVQPDAKAIFIYLSPEDQRFHLVRVTQHGSIDPTFATTTFEPFDLTQIYPSVYDPQGGYTLLPPDGAWSATLPLKGAQVLSDGKIVVAGQFSSVAGKPANGVARLHPDGTLDETFSAGGGPQWIETNQTATFFPAVEAIELQTDGKLLIAGTFEAFDGRALPGIARLNTAGSVDDAFSPVARRLKYRRGKAVLARQADGSFLLSGPYALPDESNPAFIHIKSSGGVPVIGSPALAFAVVDRPFTYQVVASGQPTGYQAAGLPPGFEIDPATGRITGPPTAAHIGTHVVSLAATNAEGTGAAGELRLIVPELPRLVSAVSRKTHGSWGNEFDQPLPLSGAPGVECRPLQYNRHSIVLTFNHDIREGAASVSAGTATPANTYVDANTMELDLSGVADRQIVTITIRNVIDEFGQTLPDTNLQIGFLQGDVNGDRAVNAGDALLTRNRSGQPVSETNFRADMNTDGVINAGDAQVVRSKSGTALP